MYFDFEIIIYMENVIWIQNLSDFSFLFVSKLEINFTKKRTFFIKLLIEIA